MRHAQAHRFVSRLVAALVLAGMAQGLSACLESNHPGRMPQLGGVRTEVGEPKEFVRETRAAAPQDFIPVGVTPPARSLAPRDEKAAAALEKDLLADRQRSQGIANRPLPRSTYDGSIPPRPAPPPKELLPQ